MRFAEIKNMSSLNEKEFINIQNSLREKINLSDIYEDFRTIAGVDLAYWNNDGQEYAVCCIVVLDYNTHEIIEKKQFSQKIEVPYIAGFLAFRELPLVLETVKLLDTKPDIYMFDGMAVCTPEIWGLPLMHHFILTSQP